MNFKYNSFIISLNILLERFIYNMFLYQCKCFLLWKFFKATGENSSQATIGRKR